MIAVIVLAAAFAASALTSNSNLASYDNVLANSTIISMLKVPNSVAADVGIGGAANFPTSANAPVLKQYGKPEILYVGAEFCPECAAERWALIIALMRFGNFTNLHYMTSSPTDIDPNTATFTFFNSTYTSDYITFVSLELTKNIEVNGTYPQLQTPNASEENIIKAYNVTGVPFLDFANESLLYGSVYDPSIINGKKWIEIASALSNPNVSSTQAIVGSANLLTVEICKVDGNQPASTCNQSYIRGIEANMR